MGSYHYLAARADGRTLRGVEEGASEAAVWQSLRRRGCFPLEVSAAPAGDPARAPRRGWVSRRADVTELISTLAALLQAGLSLDRSLEVAARGAARAEVRDAVHAARQAVREGGRIADAWALHPRLFPPVAVGLVRAAESGGHLAEAAARLAAHLERDRALRSRLTSALTYPLVILAAGAAAMLVLLFFVLPRFVGILEETGSALPRSTALLIALSTALTRGLPLLAPLGAAGALGLVLWRRTERGRGLLDRAVLHAPLVGPLRARHATARVAHTLGTLLAGGVPLLGALEIAREAAGSRAIAADLVHARDAVRRGEALSAALARRPAFPYAFIRLVEVGEETGELERVLERAAALLEAELERRMERALSLVEPAMIVLFGGAIGFVALALLQAIYGIQTTGLGG